MHKYFLVYDTVVHSMFLVYDTVVDVYDTVVIIVFCLCKFNNVLLMCIWDTDNACNDSRDYRKKACSV